MSKVLPLPPFKAFLASNIPSVYDNTLSYYDELTKLLAYMDKLVPAVNANTKGLAELREYVVHYFDNLDVQEEINNKLDQMAEGGQLQAIIAQFLETAPVFAYGTIEEMAEATNLNNGCIARVIGNTNAYVGDGAYYLVRTKEAGETGDGIQKVEVGNLLIADRIINYSETKVQETAIGLTWHYDGVGAISNYLAYSNDGVNWKQVKLGFNIGRDPSFVYDSKRKCFYFTCTPPENQSQTFTIYKTADFKTYETKVLSISTYYGKDIMAPDLYLNEEADKLVAYFSYKQGTTSKDVDGATIPDYWQYRVVLEGLDDFDNLTVDTMPERLTLAGATNNCIIDGNIIKDGDGYYLNCKDDVQKVIQVYYGVDGVNFTLLCPNILNPATFTDNSIYIEGGSWFKFNGETYILADGYSQLHNIIVGKTKDYINFDFGLTNMNQLRHPSVITVDSDDLKANLSDLKDFGYSTNNRLTAYAKTNGARHIANGFNGPITVIPGLTYTVFGNATITNVKNPFNAESFKLMFASNSGTTIKIEKIEGTTVNKTLINSVNNNEKPIEVSLCADVNSYGVADFQNIQKLDAEALQNYYTAAEGITITGGSAVKQGSIASLSLIITLASEQNGYKTILTRASSDAALLPAQKVIGVCDKASLIDNIGIFSETGAIEAQFHSAAAGSYTIFATFLTK